MSEEKKTIEGLIQEDKTPKGWRWRLNRELSTIPDQRKKNDHLINYFFITNPNMLTGRQRASITRMLNTLKEEHQLDMSTTGEETKALEIVLLRKL